MLSRTARALGLSRRAGGPTGPLFGTAPAISGTTAIGDVLTGTITAADASPGGGTVTYAWAWQRDGSDISGATGTTTTVTSYTIVAADGKANANDADVSLRLRVTATDSNGSRTVYSNTLTGPALATDDTLTLTAGDGSTAGTNLLTNDEPAATAISSATFDGETVTLGTPLTLADRGAVTINSIGTWSFDDASDFGDVLLGTSLSRTGTYTNDVGGTGTITVTVEGTAELAYSGQAHNDSEFDDLTAPTSWAIQGTQNIDLTAVGSITRVDNATAGIARTEHSATDYWSYTYMQTNYVTNFSAAVAVRVDGTTGSIFEVAGSGGAILRAYVDGSSIKAQLTDGTFDQTLTIAKPSNTTFVVGVSVDDASSTFNLTVSDGASSAATAQSVSTSTYTPFVATTLIFGQFAGAIFAVSLKNPAAVNAASLASDVATFVSTTYHKAGPSYTAPGSLSVNDNETSTLDVSSGFSAGADASPAYSVDAVTGDWGSVTINASTGVISYTSSDLSVDGSAGADVTVTDDYGQTATDTISVTVTAFAPGDIAGLANYWDFSDTGSITDTSTAVDSVADQVSGGVAIAATSTARPTTGATIGGLNALQFNGTSQYLASATNVSADNRACTLFAVIQVDSGVTSTGQVICVDDGSTRGPKIRADADRGLCRIFDTANNPVTADSGEGAATLTTTAIIIGTSDGTTAEVVINGTRYTAAIAGTFSSVLTPIAVGALSSGSGFFKGKIGCAGRYTAKLNDAQKNQLANHLAAKWSGTWSDL